MWKEEPGDEPVRFQNRKRASTSDSERPSAEDVSRAEEVQNSPAVPEPRSRQGSGLGSRLALEAAAEAERSRASLRWKIGGVLMGVVALAAFVGAKYVFPPPMNTQPTESVATTAATSQWKAPTPTPPATATTIAEPAAPATVAPLAKAEPPVEPAPAANAAAAPVAKPPAPLMAAPVATPRGPIRAAAPKAGSDNPYADAPRAAPRRGASTPSGSGTDNPY